MSENNYESFTFIDSDCNSTSELDPNRELNEKVTHLHLVLKFYFSPLGTSVIDGSSFNKLYSVNLVLTKPNEFSLTWILKFL